MFEEQLIKFAQKVLDDTYTYIQVELADGPIYIQFDYLASSSKFIKLQEVGSYQNGHYNLDVYERREFHATHWNLGHTLLKEVIQPYSDEWCHQKVKNFTHGFHSYYHTTASSELRFMVFVKLKYPDPLEKVRILSKCNITRS